MEKHNMSQKHISKQKLQKLLELSLKLLLAAWVSVWIFNHKLPWNFNLAFFWAIVGNFTWSKLWRTQCNTLMGMVRSRNYAHFYYGWRRKIPWPDGCKWNSIVHSQRRSMQNLTCCGNDRLKFKDLLVLYLY